MEQLKAPQKLDEGGRLCVSNSKRHLKRCQHKIKLGKKDGTLFWAEAAAARAGRYTVLLGHLKDLTDQRENARRKGDEKLIEFLGFQLDCIQAKIKDAMEDM